MVTLSSQVSTYMEETTPRHTFSIAASLILTHALAYMILHVLLKDGLL
jgi:hypothetical protein